MILITIIVIQVISFYRSYDDNDSYYCFHLTRLDWLDFQQILYTFTCSPDLNNSYIYIYIYISFWTHHMSCIHYMYHTTSRVLSFMVCSLLVIINPAWSRDLIISNSFLLSHYLHQFSSNDHHHIFQCQNFGPSLLDQHHHHHCVIHNIINIEEKWPKPLCVLPSNKNLSLVCSCTNMIWKIDSNHSPFIFQRKQSLIISWNG